MQKQLTAIIEKEGDGYVSYCPEYDIASQGRTIEEARNNLHEALKLFYKPLPRRRLRCVSTERFTSHEWMLPLAKLRVLQETKSAIFSLTWFFRGQTIMHLYIHLIPRYIGDMENPKGGVRGVIPGKQGYRAEDCRKRNAMCCGLLM